MTTLEPRTNLRPNVGLSLPEFGPAPASGSRPTRETLTSVVRNAVRGADHLRPVARRDSGAAFHPRTLLGLLTCCYARDIFGSTEIERLMRRDAGFRALCGDEFPDAQTLRAFRRTNRLALQECLEAALEFLNAQPGHHERLPLHTTVKAEALRRLDMAACLDTLDFDS